MDFTNPKEVPKALKVVFRYNLAGNEIMGVTKPDAGMLREPQAYIDKTQSSQASVWDIRRLRITNLAFATTEDDIRKLFLEYPMYEIPRIPRFQNNA